MMRRAANGPDGDHAQAPTDAPTCGIVMPISAIDDCPASHWVDVRNIVEEAAELAGFRARLVSAADYAGVILKEIIHNLYHDPIVVCDVSGRNPNVMFELGLRLAFDKPTILIKDDQTNYAFDTSPIEHLEYPRGLRYATMVEFKGKLADKIQATHRQATTDNDYTTFLKHFGQFKVATVETKEVSGQEFIIEGINEIIRYLRNLSTVNLAQNITPKRPKRYIEYKFVGEPQKLDEVFTRIGPDNQKFDGAEIEIDASEGLMLIRVPREGGIRLGSELKDLAEKTGCTFDARLVTEETLIRG